jgi:hypothetical protein
MYPLPLESFAYLEVWLLGHDGSVLLSVVTQALLCNFLCAGSSSTLLSAKLFMAGFHTECRHRHRVAEGGLHLYGEVNALDHRGKRFREHVLSFEEPSAPYSSNL